jgi:hypothetical protein
MYSKAVGARVNDPDNTRVYTIAEDAFFANSQARQAYKNHIARVVNRVNSINGKVIPYSCVVIGFCAWRRQVSMPNCKCVGGSEVL